MSGLQPHSNKVAYLLCEARNIVIEANEMRRSNDLSMKTSSLLTVPLYYVGEFSPSIPRRFDQDKNI
jgi:hypothetical protein